MPYPAMRMTLWRLLLALSLTSAYAMLLAGCDQQAWFDKLVPKAEADEGRQVLAQLAAGQFEAIAARLEPSLKEQVTEQQLREVAAVLPVGPPTSIAVIGANTVHHATDTDYHLTYQYQYATGVAVEYVFLQRKAGQLYLSGIQVTPIAQDLKTLNAFTLSGKSVGHYVTLLLTAAVPLFILGTLVVCWRTRLLRKKWRWVVFIALGLTKFSLDWTSGAFNFQPISFQLLGAGFTKAGPYASWVLNFSVPLGAIVFLLRRRQLMAQARVLAPTSAPDSSASQGPSTP
jgi:hypothetical protein